MTKRIFRSIFAVALTVLLATLTFILGAVNSHFTIVQFDQLRTETALASHAVSNEGLSYFDKLDSTMDCRITWISADGTVLYDNRSDTGAMVNHLEREEVRAALTEGYGESIRYSDTLMERYIYAAQRLPDGTVLRLSTSQSSVLNLTLGMSGSIVLVIIVTIILSFWLARRLSQSVVKPLNELALDDPLSNTEYEEISPLLRRLDSQQKQLRAQSAELKKKQKEFNTVTRSLSEGLVLMSSNGTILSINPAAAKLLEVTQNCLGADFAVANRNEAIAALVEQALTGQKGEQTVSLSAGQYLAAASPVRSEGSVFGVVLLLFDVTQKQQAERLRREFTANVSHELKTPLHVISGYAELMKSGIVPQADMSAFSEKIYSEAQRMIRLVEDTLRLSRLDEGDVDMQWASMDLYESTRLTVQELAAPAELAGVCLTLEGGSAVIKGIPQLVSAIGFNLTDNAIKYSHPGGKVTVRVENRETDVLLTVSDTGIGIPEDQQERIFERFYRVDKSHSKEVGGTGLGLSIVKHAALILGAQIKLDSAVGKGTTVTVSFPKVE
ncbi:MAG: PAS domain-containing sensor histidine kinase [Oscillospiraceae bacterium]|nr:PAS domain-containing sensor histidine kinase [Oscillospiraceae bacterium]